MTYGSTEELPGPVRNHLPPHAQEIYLEAYNNAFAEYADPKKRRGNASREDVSRRVAWAAVKKVYEKDQNTGEWKQKKR